MLEARCHEFSSFWTFTYDDEHYPADGSLSVRHAQLFLKRLRFSLSKVDRSLRYFLVGEYGDATARAHYHAALFGVSAAETALVSQAWTHGFVYAGELTWQSAAYVAGYVTKKMTKADDPRLKGRFPEFCRMSLHPGIGALAVPALGAELTTEVGCREVTVVGDVPASYGVGRQSMPLGRYLRRKLREEVGFETSGAQDKPSAVRAAELRALCERDGVAATLAARQMKDEARMNQVEGKARIWSKKGSL